MSSKPNWSSKTYWTPPKKRKACSCKKWTRGGYAEKHGVHFSDVSARLLKQGAKIEREHTNNKCLAKCIALDHLAEDPGYYRKLKKAGL